MNKLIVSLATLAMAFTSVAGAKTKPSNTTVAKAAPAERTFYSSTESYAGVSNENEITTMMTRGFFNSEKSCKDCSTGSNIDVSVSYLHYLKDGIQVGGEGRLQILSKELTNNDSSATLIDLVGVAAYNFQADMKNAFFAKAGLGLYALAKDNRDGYENKLGLFIGGGKRFALLSNVSYTPEVRLVKRGDIDMGVEITFLNFSVIW